MGEESAHKKIVLCVMNSLAVILGISSNNRPDYTPLRVFFVLLALYGLNVTTIYTSKLITVFTEPAHDQQVSTIKEILDAGIPIGRRNVCSTVYVAIVSRSRTLLTIIQFNSRWSRRVCRLVYKRQSVGSDNIEKIQLFRPFSTDIRKYENGSRRLHLDIIN